jgi:threonine dehydratase
LRNNTRSLLSDPLSMEEFHRAIEIVRESLPASPQIKWPLLGERLGIDVWVKHENHLPTGAFKVRGGLVFMKRLLEDGLGSSGVIAATRGNHGQSIAFAARKAGVPAVIVVPHGNSLGKNRAMKGYGADLIEAGHDFDAALSEARALAATHKLFPVPSFDPLLVLGVGTYAFELFQEIPDLDAVFVSIGLGSGVCGVLSARDALGLDTEVVGVVSTEADAYAQSFETGSLVATAGAETIADGIAVRTPAPEALDFLKDKISRIVRVSDEDILEAIKFYYEDTHNLAEGAGAAPLAALLKEKEMYAGKKVGLILSGGNLDANMLIRAFGTVRGDR